MSLQITAAAFAGQDQSVRQAKGEENLTSAFATQISSGDNIKLLLMPETSMTKDDENAASGLESPNMKAAAQVITNNQSQSVGVWAPVEVNSVQFMQAEHPKISQIYFTCHCCHLLPPECWLYAEHNPTRRVVISYTNYTPAPWLEGDEVEISEQAIKKSEESTGEWRSVVGGPSLKHGDRVRLNPGSNSIFGSSGAELTFLSYGGPMFGSEPIAQVRHNHSQSRTTFAVPTNELEMFSPNLSVAAFSATETAAAKVLRWTGTVRDMVRVQNPPEEVVKKKKEKETATEAEACWRVKVEVKVEDSERKDSKDRSKDSSSSSSSSSSSGSPQESETLGLPVRLFLFYIKHDPERAESMKKIQAEIETRFAGKEDELNSDLRIRYNADLTSAKEPEMYHCWEHELVLAEPKKKGEGKAFDNAKTRSSAETPRVVYSDFMIASGVTGKGGGVEQNACTLETEVDWIIGPLGSHTSQSSSSSSSSTDFGYDVELHAHFDLFLRLPGTGTGTSAGTGGSGSRGKGKSEQKLDLIFAGCPKIPRWTAATVTRSTGWVGGSHLLRVSAVDDEAADTTEGNECARVCLCAVCVCLFLAR